MADVSTGTTLQYDRVEGMRPHYAGDVRPARVITRKPALPISDAELRARIQWASKTSPHFQLFYDRATFSAPRAAALNELLEIAYSLIFHFTHESFAGRCSVYVIDQREPALLGRSMHPHFNAEEAAIYLIESGSRQAQEALIEMLTHAMRIARYARHYEQTPGWATLEEAFGIFLSERLSMQPDVFPFYGAESDLIAHHLYHAHSTTLHEIWNAQPHTLSIDGMILAGAFMLSLGDTFSDDTVVTFSKSDDSITNDSFRTFFGRSLKELEEAWLQHLPIAMLTVTGEEQERILQHWDRSLECRRH